MRLGAGVGRLTALSGLQGEPQAPSAHADAPLARPPWGPCRPLARGPLVLVLNPKAGRLQPDRIAAVRELLSLDGREHVLVEAGRSLASTAQQAAEHAVAHGGAVIALGGDGTLNTVGAAAWRAGCPLGLLPLGSFNYFAREHGLSAEPMHAVRCWLQGQVGPAQVGLANGRPFFVNASVGRNARALPQPGGAGKAAWWGVMQTLWREVLRRRHHRHYRLQADGERLTLRTPLLLFGNNRLQLAELGLPETETLAPGHLLALAVTDRDALWPPFGLRHGTEPLQHRPFRLMRVWPQPRVPGTRPPLLQLVCDGESQGSCESLRVEAAPQPLCLIGARAT
jgi:diacylglycerol kinase family enzyme